MNNIIYIHMFLIYCVFDFIKTLLFCFWKRSGVTGVVIVSEHCS